MAKKLYREKQVFLSRYAFGTCILLLAIIMFVIISRLWYSNEFELSEFQILLLVAALGFILSFLIFLLSLKIKFAITSKGLEYKMTPFHRHKRQIAWCNIKRIRFIQSRQSMEYIRDCNNLMLQNKYTFTGTRGLSIETHSGNQLFIGSSNFKDLERALSKAIIAYDLQAVIKKS